MGDRRARHALDPPGQADDGAPARCLLGGAAPGAYTRMLRLGEWIGEPVTPLFESWLLTAMEERMHAFYREQIGQIASAAVPRRRQRLVLLLDQLHLRPRLRFAACRACSCTSSAPRATWRGSFPPTVRYSFPLIERMWREDMQPRYRAAVADAEAPRGGPAGRRAPGADRRARGPRGRVFRLDHGPERRGVQDGDEPRAVLSAAPGSARLAAATCRCWPVSSRPAATGRDMPSSRSTGRHAPVPLTQAASATGRRDHGRVVEARHAAEAAAFAALALVPTSPSSVPAPAGRCAAPRPDSRGADRAS